MIFLLDRQNKKGFTLIELLVVIAIIGALSSIALTALNESRRKANDTKTKNQLASLRNEAEAYWLTYGNYGATTTNCATGFFIDATSSSMVRFTTTGSYPALTVLSCSTNSSDYAVQATLTNAGQYWCVDSRGRSQLSTSTLGSSVTCQ